MIQCIRNILYLKYNLKGFVSVEVQGFSLYCLNQVYMTIATNSI